MSDRVITRRQPSTHLNVMSDRALQEAVTILRELSIASTILADHLETSDTRALARELKRAVEEDGSLNEMVVKAIQQMTTALNLRRASVQVGMYGKGD